MKYYNSRIQLHRNRWKTKATEGEMRRWGRPRHLYANFRYACPSECPWDNFTDRFMRKILSRDKEGSEPRPINSNDWFSHGALVQEKYSMKRKKKARKKKEQHISNHIHISQKNIFTAFHLVQNRLGNDCLRLLS